LFTLEFDDLSAVLGRASTSLATRLQRSLLMKISSVMIQDAGTLNPAASLMRML